MSVLREARRLQRLAHRIADNEASSSAELSQLQKAADYVLGFNMKALHRVEAVFFPFIRKEMANSEESTRQVRGAFETVLDSLEKDRLRLQQMSDSIQSRCSKRSNTPTPEIAQMVAAQSGAIVDLTRSMLEREVSLVIPTVGRFIPEKEQKKFNNLVINKCLGILESRCHLVHMHEVVTEANCPKEQQLWKESIPKIPRSMVPRWKRTLYEPRSSALENL